MEDLGDIWFVENKYVPCELPGNWEIAQQLRAHAGLVEGLDCFNCQPPDGSLQQLVTPGDPSPSSGLRGHHTYPQYTYIHVAETFIHKIVNFGRKIIK